MTTRKENSTTRALTDAPRAFVDTVEATGGAQVDAKGWRAPVGDPDWIDLGEAYIQACAALSKAPRVCTEDDLPSEACT